MKVAIYALGILGTIGLALFGVFFSSHKTLANWTFFTTIVAYALAFALYWQEEIWTDERVRQAAGKTETSSSEMRRAPKLEDPTFREKVERVTFSLGRGGVHTIYSLSDLERGPREPFNFGGFKPVRLYVDKGKVYADVAVYGGSGQPPIEVKHNEFVVRPPNWDRNSDRSALEVVNERQLPVFQLVYLSPSHIAVNGVFPIPGGLLLANDAGMVINPILPTTFALKRIFKYPSWKYPGEHE